MPRPNRVIGHLTPWVEWCDELEAENKRLKSRGIEDMQHELAALREACEVFAELNVKLEQQLERQESYYMGDRAELAALREELKYYKEVTRLQEEYRKKLLQERGE